MREKVVSVDVRMVLGSDGVVRVHPWEMNSAANREHWTPAMHAVAEELRAQGADSLPSNRLRVEAFLKDSARDIAEANEARQALTSPVAATPAMGGDGATDPGNSVRATRREEDGQQKKAAARENDQSAVLPEAHSGSPLGEKCERCEGSGWLYGHELDEPEDPPTDQHYDCTTCNGTGRKTEESDGKNNQASDPETNSEAAVLRAQTGPEPAHRRDDPALPDGEGRGLPRSVHLAEQDTAGEADRGASKDPVRPPGIPASATIWAEVVDGLGRKVGAWFDGGDVPLVEMWDPDSGHPWSWAPDCESQWMGDFDERMTPSAAAQCRQLYEKGLAHLAAEATPKPTLIPVDLTELREAVEAFDRGRGAWTVDDLIEAARRLLSSGGAP